MHASHANKRNQKRKEKKEGKRTGSCIPPGPCGGPAVPPVAMRAQGFRKKRDLSPALKHSTAYVPEKWGAVGGLPIFLHGAGVMPACGIRLHRNCNCQLAAENPGAVGAPDFTAGYWQLCLLAVSDCTAAVIPAYCRKMESPNGSPFFGYIGRGLFQRGR